LTTIYVLIAHEI